MINEPKIVKKILDRAFEIVMAGPPGGPGDPDPVGIAAVGVLVALRALAEAATEQETSEGG
jgi:hypothetical protein